MPPDIADAVLAILESLPEEAWELSEQDGDEAAARHRFWSADVCDVPQLAPLRGVFWRMLPKYRGEPTLPIFSCARYGSSDCIGRHDDRAHVPFFGDENVYSRTVAAIWYLTRDWTEEDGGCLMDLQPATSSDPKQSVPIYNSLVAFDVPHWHAVSAVTATRYRYSIFGWWHQQGKRYELPDVERPMAAPNGGKAAGGAAKKRPGVKKGVKKQRVATTEALSKEGGARRKAKRRKKAPEDAAAEDVKE